MVTTTIIKEGNYSVKLINGILVSVNYDGVAQQKYDIFQDSVSKRFHFVNIRYYYMKDENHQFEAVTKIINSLNNEGD